MALSRSGRAVVVGIATLLGIVVTANLGAWQLRRAAQKVELQQAIESRAVQPAIDRDELPATAPAAEALDYRSVHLRGRWVPERTVFLENRQMRGRVGFDVVTPLLLEGRRDAVLVQRGWAPRDQNDRTRLPPLPTPTGIVDLSGRIAPPPGRLFEFAGGGTGPIRQNIDIEAFQAESGLRLLPWSVQAADSAATVGDGLLRDWPLPAVDVQKHYGYAFQWFALCALMAGLYVWFQLVRPRLRRSA